MLLRALAACLVMVGFGCGSASPLDANPGEGAGGSGTAGFGTVPARGAGGATGVPTAANGEGGAAGVIADAGTGGGARAMDSAASAVDLDAGVFQTPAQCSSGTSWTGGNRGSPMMHPGLPCLSCHRGGGAPRFVIAGTVYATAHEPNDCNGSRPGTQANVVITAADGTTLTLPVNDVGNFYSTQPVALPFTARVVSGAAQRVMNTPQTTGDCNSCHTQPGANGAPGRIVLP